MDWKHDEAILAQLLARQDDLFAFVMFCFPWGRQNTPLASYKGPKAWQVKYLDEVSQHIRDNRARISRGEEPHVWKHATASGRGPGKSAVLAWLAWHQLSVVMGSTTIVTANREEQLKTATFAEIGKWHTMALNGRWFDRDSLTVRPTKVWAEAMAKQKGIDSTYWAIFGRLWTEENPDAFVGTHNMLGVRLLVDEASGFPSAIGDKCSGFFTPNALHHFWDMFSQARRNEGTFYDAFHRTNEDGSATDWRTLSIDARTVEGSNLVDFENDIKLYGIDSYKVRVEILGKFPNQGEDQFIASSLVRDAQDREILHPDPGAPLVMGVDVAYKGDDWTVCRFRQGLDGRSIEPQKWQGMDFHVTADRIGGLIDQHKPDAVVMDRGYGEAVAEILKRRNYHVHLVGFGDSSQKEPWANRGTELAAKAREWLASGTLHPKANKLFGDLTGRRYKSTGKGNDKIILEQKDEFKKRFGRSPDDGDAFVLTFAVSPARRDRVAARATRSNRARGVDYDPVG